MNVREHLAGGAPLLFDGAMGTYFASLPGRSEARCELGDLDHPEEIAAIHRAYLEAGCRAVKTNTFTAGADLAQGHEALARQIIESACRLALDCAAPFGAYVFADIGPAPEEKALCRRENYYRQADIFLEHGVRHFLVETLPTDDGVSELARCLKERCPKAFLLVSFAVAPDGITRDGLSGRALFERTAALPEVDAVGFNCVSGPHHLLEFVRGLDLDKLNGKALSVMPNAGYPTVLGRRVVYQGQADYFAAQLADIAQAGAAIVGGCCGTQPRHIAHTAQALHTLTAKPAALPAQPRTKPGVQPGQNRLRDKLEAGKRVIAVELDPPADDHVDAFMEGVRTLRDAGADAVTVADCPVGRPRADSSLLACKIRRETGVEPLPHLTCRDRNLNATKALLLGLSMEEVHNVLLVTGDPIPSQDRDAVKSVYNFNSRKLARYVSGLNGTVFRTPFRIFGALNVNAANFGVQLRLALEKEDNGVSGFLTQPVLSQEALDNLKLARETLKGKILGGIYPVVSYQNACFLNNEIAGMRIAGEIAALYQGKERAEAEALAVRISLQIARAIAPYTDGFYLMTPFRRVELVSAILRQIRAGGL